MNDRDGNDRSDAPEPLLRAAIDALPEGLDPGRDLWPGIAARLSRRRRFLRAALAAAAALALAVAVWKLVPPAPPTQIAAPIAPPAPSGPRLAAFSAGDRALVAIHDQLVREIEAKQDRLPAETRALVFENLRTIDRALAEIEAALEAAPGDPALGRTYLSYRERQIGLLRQANRAASRL